MRAACYEKQGSAKDDLTLGEMPDRHPAVGEVCIRIAASDINPGDIKKRPSDLPSANSLIGRPMPDWERGAFRQNLLAPKQRSKPGFRRSNRSSCGR